MMKIYLIYVILSGFILFLFTNRQWQTWLFKMVIVSFLPIIGWLTPSIWPKKWIKNNDKSFQQFLDGQSNDINVQLLKTQHKLDLQDELNSVSVEEALIISNYDTRRKVLINIIKQDAMQFIDALKMAVINEDTETSHFAVAAVIEVKRELTILLQKLSVEFNQNPQNEIVAKAYAEVIKEYLRSGFLDEQSIVKYRVTFIQVIAQLISINAVEEQDFEDKINMELSLHDLVAAENTAIMFKQLFPNSERAFLSSMNVHYEAKSYEKLMLELQSLKSSTIILSNNALKVVRYWTEVSNR